VSWRCVPMNIIHTLSKKGQLKFKGTVSRDFRPSVFSLTCTPGSPDSWAKTVLHIDSNLRRSSIKFEPKAKLNCIARSWFSFFKKSFIYDSALCNSMWNSSPKFSCRLRAMRHSAESRLPAMRHSAESIFVGEFNGIAPRIRIYMQTRFSPCIRGPRGTV
jgi:hypothetical protein